MIRYSHVSVSFLLYTLRRPLSRMLISATAAAATSNEVNHSAGDLSDQAKDPQTKKNNENGPKHNSPQGSDCFCRMLVILVILNEPPLAHDLVLDSQQPLCQGFRPGRAPGNINVYRNDLVYAFTNRVGELKAPQLAQLPIEMTYFGSGI